MAQLASLSIACRATLNMHSLNNEGGEGNQIQTRMVDVVDGDAQRYTVNAISGDMMRHVLAEHLLRVATTRGLPLSDGARELNANRINADTAAMEQIKNLNSDPLALDYMLRHCAVTEMLGTLITQGNRALPRTSVVEFGWVVGLPDRVHTNSFFHVKYNPDRGSEQRRRDADDADQAGANRGQAIFHRPASSGVYALVSHLELARIGYNDILQRYALDEDERTARAQALLDAVLYTLLELNGAMRAAQLPHLTALQGVITTSSGIVPAPLISPLTGGADDVDGYRQQARAIATILNGQNGSELDAMFFDDIVRFAEIMRTISAEVRLASLTPVQA